MYFLSANIVVDAKKKNQEIGRNNTRTTTCWKRFAVKLDKRTCISGTSQLLVLSRFYFNMEIDEELIL